MFILSAVKVSKGDRFDAFVGEMSEAVIAPLLKQLNSCSSECAPWEEADYIWWGAGGQCSQLLLTHRDKRGAAAAAAAALTPFAHPLQCLCQLWIHRYSSYVCHLLHHHHLRPERALLLELLKMWSLGGETSTTKGPNTGLNQHKWAHLAHCCCRILDTAGMFDQSMFKPAETWTFLDLPECQRFTWKSENHLLIINLLIHHLQTNLTGYCSCLSQLEIGLLFTHQMGVWDKSLSKMLIVIQGPWMCIWVVAVFFCLFFPVRFVSALHHYVHCYGGKFYHAGASGRCSLDW